MRYWKRIDLERAWDDRVFNTRELIAHANELIDNEQYEDIIEIKSIEEAICEMSELNFEIKEITKKEYEHGKLNNL